MTDTTETIGKRITFCALFEEFGHVQIPIIQRDYAQGRAGQEELRNEFLRALKDALSKNSDHPPLPLNLDFVYGSGFNNNGNTGAADGFAPLDGQQRLTTLFLLHWYLAWKDEQTEDFRGRFLRNHKSLFTYEVRPSSRDFFNSLAEHFPDEKLENVLPLKDLIQDQAWFFLSWKNDPTIVSALTVLESIHEQFKECDGYYERLTNNEHPRITFQLLQLKNFGLSDDLYIKMNARGKPLTAFENFKARLEEHLDELLPNDMRDLHGNEVSVKVYFSYRMDTIWADLFWKHRDTETNLFDDKVMRLINAVSLVCLDTEDEEVTETVNNLRRPNISFAKYDELGCLNEQMLKTLIALLDYWSEYEFDKESENTASVYSPSLAFDTVTGDSITTYPQLAKFGAFSRFIHAKGSEDQQILTRWLRVIHNLVENTDIERPSDLIDALKAIEQLTPSANEILEYLASGENITFFNRQQVLEERIKAALILRAKNWPEAIYQAERHKYFSGQIKFLLEFSDTIDHWKENKTIEWSAGEEMVAFNRFSEYWKKANEVFGPYGLKRFDNYKWERALLCKGDYTLDYGMNKSLLGNSERDNRRMTWKRLLRGPAASDTEKKKRQLVKEILDSIDLQDGVEASLDNIIKNSVIDEPWRKLMVELPDAIGYCKQRMFREGGRGKVYLISKLIISSEHVELWSYHLHHVLLRQMQETGDLEPFDKRYQPNWGGYSEPTCALLKWEQEGITIKIHYSGYKFIAAVDESESSTRDMIINYLEQSCESCSEDGFHVPDDKIESVVRGLIAEVSQIAAQ